ncbi:hypothetical protein [Streptomyces sp. NPDC059604]|uniref:hypothetical protein n=1 Tax=Streptomyces sp. NPDC059604 TaxID=3346881 RepID=UPI003693E399
MTSTGTTPEPTTSEPGGYAAARLRLLQGKARSGPSPRGARPTHTHQWETPG